MNNKASDNGTELSQAEIDKRRDNALRRALNTPPSKHETKGSQRIRRVNLRIVGDVFANA